jgi:serine/threonine protein kinase
LHRHPQKAPSFHNSSLDSIGGSTNPDSMADDDEPLHIIEPAEIGPYVLHGTIGEGAFAVVKLVQHRDTNVYHACKIVPKDAIEAEDLQDRFEREVRIHQQIRHPGVVCLLDLLSDENNYYVVMEFCPDGDLFQVIIDHGGVPEPKSRVYVKQLVDTLVYLHRNQISHRDLKPENLLIDKFGRMKLSDFGLAAFLPRDNLVSTPCGSPSYASPECLSGEAYDGHTTDAWSVGVIVFAMVTGTLPWTEQNPKKLFKQIRTGEYTIPDNVSAPCAAFIRGLLTVDIRQRMTLEQALGHAWLTELPAPIFPGDSPISMVSLKTVDKFFGHDSDDEVANAEKQVGKSPSLGLIPVGVLTKLIAVKATRAQSLTGEQRPRQVISASGSLLFPIQPPLKPPLKPPPKAGGLPRLMPGNLLVKPVIQKRPL